jgi:ABC-type transport system involved in multi-copper enzyme maturation permease subunit
MSGRTPGVFFGVGRIFELSLGQMLWSRRTIFMGLVVGAPVLLAVAVRVLVEMGVPLTRVGREELSGAVLFGLMFWLFFLRLAVPVLAVFYGSGLIADEVEDRTLTYLFTRPVRREAVFLGKYLAFLVCTVSVVLPAVVLVWLAVAGLGGNLGAGFPDLLKDLGILAAGLATYGAVFGLVGAALRRPLVIGLVFVFGWESFAMALPGHVRRLTVAHYLEGFVPHAMPADSPLQVMQQFFRATPGLTESLLGLAIITTVALALGARSAARKEYVLTQ